MTESVELLDNAMRWTESFLHKQCSVRYARNGSSVSKHTSPFKLPCIFSTFQ